MSSSRHDGTRLRKETSAPKGQRNEMRMISRGVAVLRALADHPSGLSLGQIAKATGLARSTVQRLVGALEAEQLVSTSTNVAGVRLGVELARLGSSVHKEVRHLFRPHIERLHSRVQDTIDLTTLMDDGAVVIDQISSPQALRVVSYIGLALPLHCTASGKAHLTQMEESIAARYLRRPLKRFTANTLADNAQLLALVGTADANLCHVDREEYADGVCAVGLPIRGLANGNYALAISTPTQRFEDRLAFLSRELKACQTAIERAVGVK